MFELNYKSDILTMVRWLPSFFPFHSFSWIVVFYVQCNTWYRCSHVRKNRQKKAATTEKEILHDTVTVLVKINDSGTLLAFSSLSLSYLCGNKPENWKSISIRMETESVFFCANDCWMDKLFTPNSIPNLTLYLFIYVKWHRKYMHTFDQIFFPFVGNGKWTFRFFPALREINSNFG